MPKSSEAPSRPGSRKPKTITPKSPNQQRYLEAVREHTITYGVGPAGSGKTFLAVALAVRMLMNKEVEKIIISRPAIEAGEKLGFLPGSLEEKVSPYLRPLHDALHYMLPKDMVQRLIEQGVIEIAPLAYMRGRTLSDAFIILDEAQNTTSEQMKMFLTRIGLNTKVVITGDPSQIDLPRNQQSGLQDSLRVLKRVNEIAVCWFDEEDIVRNPVVRAIVKAYNADYERNS